MVIVIKRLTIALLVVIFACFSTAAAQVVNKNTDGPVIKGNSAEVRSIQNKAFFVGENLSFDIYWEIAHVGNATLSVTKTLNYNGRTVYQVDSRAQSNKVISSFYRVDDRVTSYIDTAGIFSHRLEKHLSEGKYKADRLFLLNQVDNIGISHRDTVNIPQYCQDILSSFYYIRTQELKIGSTFEVPNFDNGKVYDIIVNVLKKQRIRVPAGTFDCIIVEPKLKGEGLFKHQGKIKIYLTDDERKIPVLLVSEVVFGQVAAKLTKIEGTF
ncbi:DUF3108 domain-containing protein [candidate division KSB1 bacterium]